MLDSLKNRWSALSNKSKGSIIGGGSGAVLGAGAGYLNALSARKKAERDIRNNSGIFGKIANAFDPGRAARLAKERVSVGKRVASGALAGGTVGAGVGYGIGAYKDKKENDRKLQAQHEEEIRAAEEKRKQEAERQRLEMERQAAEEKQRQEAERKAANRKRKRDFKKRVEQDRQIQATMTPEQLNLLAKARKKGMNKNAAIQWALNNTKEAVKARKNSEKEMKARNKRYARIWRHAKMNYDYSQGCNLLQYRNDLINFANAGHVADSALTGALGGSAIAALMSLRKAKTKEREAEENAKKGIINHIKNHFDKDRVKRIKDETTKKHYKEQYVKDLLKGAGIGALVGTGAGLV